MTGANRNQETMKVTMKMGGGAGGAIGAVFLLGGALATAALASAFVVGRNGRSSGLKTRDESDKAQECKNPREIKEVESESDTAFLVSNQEFTLDVDPIVEEMNDETPDNIGDKLELIDSISDGHVVIEEKVPLLDEGLQFEPRNDDGVTIELTNENQSLDEQVVVEEEKTESEPTDEYEAVEITEKQTKPKEDHDELHYDEEEIKVISVDNNNEVEEESEPEEIHVIDNGEMIFSESDSEDGQKAIQPVLESCVIENENVVVETGKENEFVEESKGEEEESDQPDELIVVENHEDPTCLVIEELIISSENDEVTTKDSKNYLEGDKNETSLDFAVVGQEKQDEDEDVETIYIENNDSVTKKNEDDQTVLSDEVRLVDREMGGKIQEDYKAVKNVELDSDEKSENRTMNSGKSFNVKKYVIMNNRLTNSTNRRLIIAIMSVMSSLSCSWFFGLSSVQLCVVMFLTMAMSTMVTE